MNRSDMVTAAGMGAMAGMRALSAPMFLSQKLSEDGIEAKASRMETILASSTISRVLPLLALGEFVFDKIPGMPPRIARSGLIVRVISGAFVGAAVARHQKVSVLGLAVVGAAASLASSFALYAARQFVTERLHVPNIVAGFLEDALVASAGTRLTAAMG
ncbi:DUF4126 family protein [Melittangium boletus]|uniref:DUF4126 domain-containing protein n=1 Tax=Melittangium boletus DSM 14713 TaxID=1294270 RepID=A0A250IDT4_9BACT|nr:DUF4126 family protein [Melittangium boletus]ATB29116.1 hypothetical protein MEBOL_002565 [Melittangium boletus DSM 14713]